MAIKFKAKIWKTGKSSVMTVPSQFIDNELIDPNKEYWVTLTENNEGDE